ncbi:MAG: hypothetical protein ACLP1E_13050 [Acidimicrobiales bacterium]
MSKPDRVHAGIPARPLSAPAEVADAIAAAVVICWPRATAAGDPLSGRRKLAGGEPEHSWRFSGRWWNVPASLRRDRPRAEQAWR